MPNTYAPSEAELVQMHQNALRKLKNAQRLAVFIPLTILLVVATALWWRVSTFFKVGVKQTITNIMKEAPRVATPVAKDALDAVGRVAPVYREAIAKVFARDEQIYKNLIASQTEAFTAYGTELQGTIKNRFKELVGRVTVNVEEHLCSGMTADEVKEFEKYVAVALYERLNKEMESNWSAHKLMMKQIGQDLYAVSQNTPRASGAKPVEVIGAGLELIGIKLQEAK